VNTNNKLARSASLFSSLSDVLVPDAEYPAELQELYSDLYCLGMDQAIGIQKASLEAAVRLQTEVIDSYKHAAWCTPQFASWLDLVSQSLAYCMEWQMNLLSMLVPARPALGVGGSLALGANAEELEHSMDVGIGHHKNSPASRRMLSAG
jgi:hypothetical protein